MTIQQVAEGLTFDHYTDWPAPTAAEKESFLEENKRRGTLRLVEFRNSVDGIRCEMALEIELGITYGRIDLWYGNQYTLRS